jgi:ribosomal protein S18 acetylase RimI-like enzyme
VHWCVGFYVRPQYRNAGVGRALAEQATTAAAEKGYQRICLDTLRSMTAAITLYRSMGFKDALPYYHNPISSALFLARELARESLP